MARATTPKGPKPHESKWTLVFSIKVMRFDTLQEAEAERDKALVRGESVLHPAAARSIGGHVLTRQAGLVTLASDWLQGHQAAERRLELGRRCVGTDLATSTCEAPLLFSELGRVTE